MKIKKLASVISRAKQICLYNTESGQQWAGTSSALYLLPSSLPTMEPELLTMIMDIKPEKAAEFYLEEGPAPVDFPNYDNGPADSELFYDIAQRVIYDGMDMLPLKTQGGGMYMIQTKQLGPVEDAQQPGLYLRPWGGQPVIAVKDGLFITAIIKPVMHKPGFVSWLEETFLCTKASEQLRKERAEE